MKALMGGLMMAQYGFNVQEKKSSFFFPRGHPLWDLWWTNGSGFISIHSYFDVVLLKKVMLSKRGRDGGFLKHIVTKNWIDFQDFF